MVKIFQKIMGLVIYVCIHFTFLNARINFGSQHSAIKVSQEAALKISSSNLQIAGTIAKGDSALITGNPIGFSNGLLEVSGKPIAISGSYNPSDLSTNVSLQGDNYLRVEPGAVISHLFVEGCNNILEGSPYFEQPLELANRSAQLTLALHNRLNKNIALNQGSLLLENDLSLMGNVFFTGPGTIKLNGRNLYLGSYYDNAWSTNLNFDDSKGIFLNGDIRLNGRWRFNGDNKINGNGFILTLQKSQGFSATEKRRLLIKRGASLALADVYLKNLNNKMLTINAHKDNVEQGVLSLSNVTIELAEDVEIDSGEVIITGPTTIILNGHTLSFSDKGFLKVTDRLYINKIGFSSGDIRVGTDSIASKASGTSDNNYSISAKALVSHLSQNTNDGQLAAALREEKSALQSLGLDSQGRMYLSALLDQSVTVPVDRSITIADNLVIDGQGTAMTFHTLSGDSMRGRGSKKAQLAVSPSKQVTLKNITLSRITSRTFDLQQTYDDMTKEVVSRGALSLDENVILELEEDTVISQGFIKVLSSAGGNVPIIRGVNGKKKLVIHPTSKLSKNTSLFDLGSASLKLENVELVGIQNISYDAKNGASIVLGGGATVNVVATNKDVNNPEIDLNFDVEGVNNELVVRQDGLLLAGSISFSGYAATNFLSIRCAPLQLLPDSHFLKEGVDAGMPVLRFGGNPGIYLTTNTSATGIEFLNRTAFIRLEHPNSFVVSGGKKAFGNATLKAKKLHMLGNPIRQMTQNFVVDVNALHGFIDVELGRRTAMLEGVNSTPNTSFAKKMHKDVVSAQEHYEEIKRSNLQQAGVATGKRRPVKKTSRKLPVPLTRCPVDAEFIKDGMVSKIVKRKKSVLFDPLDTYNMVVDYDFDCNGNPLKGAIYVAQGIIKNFYVADNVLCHIAFGGDAQLVQQFGQHVSFLSKDNITVEGRNNVMTLADTFTIDCDVALDKGAELIVNFINVGGNKPTLYIGPTSTLSIPEGATIRCIGEGTVVLDSNAKIVLQGDFAVDEKTLKGAVFQLEHNVVLKAAGATSLTGVGIVNVLDGAQIKVEDTFVVAQNEDECIAFNFDNAALYVEGTQEHKAYLTTGIGTSFWSFTNKSLLTIANDAVFGLNINAVKNNAIELKRGYFASFVLSGNSTLYLAKGGSLMLAPNKPTQRLRRELALQLFADPASWLGEGEVEFLDTNGKRVTKQPIKESRGVRLVDSQTTMKRLADALQGNF